MQTRMQDTTFATVVAYGGDSLFQATLSKGLSKRAVVGRVIYGLQPSPEPYRYHSASEQRMKSSKAGR